MLFISKRDRLPKMSFMLQDMKIGPKSNVPGTLFCKKAFNCNLTNESTHDLNWDRGNKDVNTLAKICLLMNYCCIVLGFQHSSCNFVP